MRSRVRHLFVPGISRSSPASTAWSIEYTPNLKPGQALRDAVGRTSYQSLMINALVPHSLRRIS